MMEGDLDALQLGRSLFQISVWMEANPSAHAGFLWATRTTTASCFSLCLYSPGFSIISTYYFYYGEKNKWKNIIGASDDKPHSSPGSTRHSLRPEEDRVHLDTRAIKLCGTITVLWRCFGGQDESQRKLAMASHKGLSRFMPPNTHCLH